MLFSRLRFSLSVLGMLGGRVTPGRAQVPPTPRSPAGDVTPPPAPRPNDPVPPAAAPALTSPVPSRAPVLDPVLDPGLVEQAHEATAAGKVFGGVNAAGNSWIYLPLDVVTSSSGTLGFGIAASHSLGMFSCITFDVGDQFGAQSVAVEDSDVEISSTLLPLGIGLGSYADPPQENDVERNRS